MLDVKNLGIYQDRRWLWHQLSFSLSPGERLGIGAPSGFGKSTLGRILALWQRPTTGTILYDGKPLTEDEYCPIQLVPQHPEQSFNPYRNVGQALADAWQPDGTILSRFSVQPQWLKRRPLQLSGGELARIALIRALDPRTRILIADEITSQLDPLLQRQIWHELLTECQRRPLGLIVFSHNHALLGEVCTQIWQPDKHPAP